MVLVISDVSKKYILAVLCCHAGKAVKCAAVTQDCDIYKKLLSHLPCVRLQNKNAQGLMYK